VLPAAAAAAAAAAAIRELSALRSEIAALQQAERPTHAYAACHSTSTTRIAPRAGNKLQMQIFLKLAKNTCSNSMLLNSSNSTNNHSYMKRKILTAVKDASCTKWSAGTTWKSRSSVSKLHTIRSKANRVWTSHGKRHLYLYVGTQS
jgi:hypothetical protein